MLVNADDAQNGFLSSPNTKKDLRPVLARKPRFGLTCILVSCTNVGAISRLQRMKRLRSIEDIAAFWSYVDLRQTESTTLNIRRHPFE